MVITPRTSTKPLTESHYGIIPTWPQLNLSASASAGTDGSFIAGSFTQAAAVAGQPSSADTTLQINPFPLIHHDPLLSSPKKTDSHTSLSFLEWPQQLLAALTLQFICFGLMMAEPPRFRWEASKNLWKGLVVFSMCKWTVLFLVFRTDLQFSSFTQ